MPIKKSEFLQKRKATMMLLETGKENNSMRRQAINGKLQQETKQRCQFKKEHLCGY
jgi:hypothetical protein